jgi:hypothetical protein
MKNLNSNTEKNTTFANNAETAEKKELTNRQIQFERLLEASHNAKGIKAQFVKEASTLEAAMYYANLPINHYLINYVYRDKGDGITEFKKFQEWKQAGASVQKGAKAYPIWGQPVGIQKEEEAEAKGENYEATAEENRRFPMCYVFSNLQVRATTTEQGATC